MITCAYCGQQYLPCDVTNTELLRRGCSGCGGRNWVFPKVEQRPVATLPRQQWMSGGSGVFYFDSVWVPSSVSIEVPYGQPMILRTEQRLR